MSDLAQRYTEIVDRIDLATKSSNRSSADVTLVVVTKNHPYQIVLDLLALGARNFGENRDQEAAPKAQELANHPTDAFTWHFIGQLQSNKVKSVLDYAKVIHSLDRESLLTELQKRTEDRVDQLGVFIQVNLTEDPDRGGVGVPDLTSFAEKVVSAKGLRLEGLMGVGGLQVEPEAEFERLANLSAELQKVDPQAKGLSMGMSSDFESAIAFGATHLRIGSAITGIRP